jgi:hypothetical protein
MNLNLISRVEALLKESLRIRIKEFIVWIKFQDITLHVAHIAIKLNIKSMNVHLLKIMWSCCNPRLRLATKAKACKVVGQEGSLGVTSHALGSAKECEGMNLHTTKWTPILGVGVPMDSQIFKGRLQGPKPIKLKSSLYHWKTIET